MFKNKISTIVILLSGLIIHIHAQVKDPIKDYDYIQNKEVISENKLDAHASFISDTSEENALNKNADKASFYQSLDGVWKFKWVRSPKDKPSEFINPKRDVFNWNDIKVPCNWEVEGFGISIYANHQYEFTNYNPVGSYRRDFNLVKDWDGKEIFLHIGAMKNTPIVFIGFHLKKEV